jgi:LacI family transcriptional regulator
MATTGHPPGSTGWIGTRRRTTGTEGGASSPVTMRDVAAAAGVSVKTVSRVVNDEPGVRPEVRQRVLDAVSLLGFRRNVAARSLRAGNSIGAVAVVVADLRNPFNAGIAEAVEQVADRHGRVVVVATSGDAAARERELALNITHRAVDGLIIVPVGPDHRYLVPEMRMGLPIVFVDREGGQIRADSVVLDNAGGTRAAIDHFILRDHRRIGFVGGRESVRTAAERLDGYRAALAEAGIPYDPELVIMGMPEAERPEAGAKLLALADPPTAIFAASSRTCAGVLRAIRASGRRVSVIGFDDFDLADLLPVPLTVVGYDPQEIGRTAAELLFSRLGGDSRPPQKIVIPTKLVVRGSGEIDP